MSITIDTCEEMVRTLEECRLVPADEVAQVRSFLEAAPNSTPRDLAAFLTKQELLTQFQADALLRGAGNHLAVGDYTLVENIGTGSMGAVYKARCAHDDLWHVIKSVPRRNIVNIAGIIEKVKKIQTIDTSRVSALTHLETRGERVYLVWPFFDGGERLEDILKRVGRLPGKQVAQVGLQVALCLFPFHKAGLVHGILKPTDVQIGSDRRVRLLDFGVGFLLMSERGKSLLSTTTNGRAMAKGLDCASPESIEDPQNRTALGDQYSLGCILYRCLTGQPPFPGDNPVKKMLGHQFEEPTPIHELAPEVPARLEAVIQRMMRKNPEERYPDIEAAAHELQAAGTDNRPSTASAPRMATPRPNPAEAAAPAPPRPTTPIPGTRAAVTPPPAARGATPMPASVPTVAKQMPTAPRREPAPAKKSALAGTLITIAGVTAGLVAGLVYWYISR